MAYKYTQIIVRFETDLDKDIIENLDKATTKADKTEFVKTAIRYYLEHKNKSVNTSSNEEVKTDTIAEMIEDAISTFEEGLYKDLNAYKNKVTELEKRVANLEAGNTTSKESVEEVIIEEQEVDIVGLGTEPEKTTEESSNESSNTFTAGGYTFSMDL